MYLTPLATSLAQQLRRFISFDVSLQDRIPANGGIGELSNSPLFEAMLERFRLYIWGGTLPTPVGHRKMVDVVDHVLDGTTAVHGGAVRLALCCGRLAMEAENLRRNAPHVLHIAINDLPV